MKNDSHSEEGGEDGGKSPDPRTRFFQWCSDRYPTHRVQSSFLARYGYRLLLELIRPDGGVVVQAQDYRVRFTRNPKRGVARALAMRRWYEMLVSQAFSDLTRPGMHVLDIGANVGHFAMLAASRVGPGGRVSAFEPAPHLFRALNGNIALNPFSNVRTFQQAVGAKSGSHAFHLSSKNPGGHTLHENLVDVSAGTIQVEVITLDEFAATLGKDETIGLIKMDVEGNEGEVIAGAAKVLRDHRPALIIEYWTFGLQLVGDDPLEFLRNLNGLGYDLRLIDPIKDKILDGPVEELAAYFPPEPGVPAGYLVATPRG